MSRLFFMMILACGLPSVYPVTKGQRVRSSPDIPVTQFTCVGRPPGYYADLETGCQVYHMCTEGGNQFSYRCPNTTLFQQRMLICAHWYQVNCSRSEQHYAANLLIGQRDKPFVYDDSVFSKEKQVKTLHNPEVLQNLVPSPRENSARQAKSQVPNENRQVNRVFQNNFKREGESSSGKSDTISLQNPLPTTFAPVSTKRTTEDLSSLPLAGSVLPGGWKSLQFPPSRPGLSSNSQKFLSPISPTQDIRSEFTSNAQLSRQDIAKPVSFILPTQSSNIIERINLFATTKNPVSFTSKQYTDAPNVFKPISLTNQSQIGNLFTKNSSEPNLEFLPPTDQQQSDLAVASQENALSSRKSTTLSPSLEFDLSLPETNVKALIEPTNNGSLPEDNYITFIKRFNPFEDVPVETDSSKVVEAEPEYHKFINRFVPFDGKIIPENNLGEQPQHVFINRFVLTPDEQKKDKDRQQVDQLHNLLPPDDQLTISFPNFDLMPPVDDSDDSESNKIELHLQDPRRTFFIPREDGNDFSKADAAPIVVTIPLHSYNKSPPMWFRSEKSEDPCARCHPSFIVNKETCMPCVIIR